MRSIIRLVVMAALLGGTPALAVAAADPFQPDRPTLTRRGTAGFVPGVSVGDAPGVAVAQVMPGSAAERAGLRAGDIITAIGNEPTPDPAALSSSLAGIAAGRTLEFTIRRDGAPTTLPLTLVPRSLELPGTTTTYGEALTDNGYAVRTILTIPDNADAPLPAVFFI